MFGELPDELLTDHSGGAENAYVDFFRLHACPFKSSLTARGAPPPLASLGDFAPRSGRRRSLLKKKPAGLDGPAGVVILL